MLLKKFFGKHILKLSSKLFWSEGQYGYNDKSGHITCYIEFSLTRNQRTNAAKAIWQNMLASNSLLSQQSQELDKHIKLN
jgi:hypothetical protein